MKQIVFCLCILCGCSAPQPTPPHTREQPASPEPVVLNQPRSRTIKEAKARQSPNQLSGARKEQDGNVHLQFVSSLGGTNTQFGAYDRAFLEAVTSRWYDLLDNVSEQDFPRGKVVLQFHLDYKGLVTEMKVLENTVSEKLALLCQKAVLDLAPYDQWPREMRLKVGADFREIRFTFYYN